MGESGADDAAETDGAGVTVADAAPPRRADPAEAFGWRGWVLVATIVVAFFVIPAAIVVLPQAQGLIADLRLSLGDAYLVLPLPAAILLGAVAVWAALASRRE